MRILIANHTSTVRGGAEQYVLGVRTAFARAGHDVALITEDASTGASPRGLTDFRDSARDLERLRAWKPDVVLVNGLRSPRLETTLLGEYPCVLFAHNFYGTCLTGAKRRSQPFTLCRRQLGLACLPIALAQGCGPSGERRPGRDALLQLARRRLLVRYRSVVVASEYMADEYRSHGISDVAVIPYFVPPPAAPRPDSSERIAFVGRLTALKGAAVLLQAVEQAADLLGRTLTLVVLGEGPAERTLLSRSPTVRVERHGWLEPDARDRVLRSCAVLGLPSLWPEPFGLVGLEAARVGVPCVASDAGGISDWLTHERNGLLVSLDRNHVGGLASALVRILGSASLRAAMSDASLTVAAQFHETRHVTALGRALERART